MENFNSVSKLQLHAVESRFHAAGSEPAAEILVTHAGIVGKVIGHQTGLFAQAAHLPQLLEDREKAFAAHVTGPVVDVLIAAVEDHRVETEFFKEIPRFPGEPARVVGDEA